MLRRQEEAVEKPGLLAVSIAIHAETSSDVQWLL